MPQSRTITITRVYKHSAYIHLTAGGCMVQWLVSRRPARGEVTGEPTCPLYQAGRGGPSPRPTPTCTAHRRPPLHARLLASRRAPLTPPAPVQYVTEYSFNFEYQVEAVSMLRPYCCLPEFMATVLAAHKIIVYN